MPKNELIERRLREWRAEWALTPVRRNLREVTYLEARHVEDAETLARDHIERTTGIADFKILSIHEVKELPEGGVIS